jgi:hypothetical protein
MAGGGSHSHSLISGQKKTARLSALAVFSGCLGAYLAQSLRQRLGKAIKVKPESVHAVHVEYLQCGFKHDSGLVGKRYSPRV